MHCVTQVGALTSKPSHADFSFEFWAVNHAPFQVALTLSEQEKKKNWTKSNCGMVQTGKQELFGTDGDGMFGAKRKTKASQGRSGPFKGSHKFLQLGFHSG